jgi:hypothetical protein
MCCFDVHRLHRPKTLSSPRLQKIRRPQRTPSYQNRRVRIDSPTRRLPSGKSASRNLKRALRPVRHHLHRIHCKTTRREARALISMLHLLSFLRASANLGRNSSKCESEPKLEADYPHNGGNCVRRKLDSLWAGAARPMPRRAAGLQSRQHGNPHNPEHGHRGILHGWVSYAKRRPKLFTSIDSRRTQGRVEADRDTIIAVLCVSALPMAAWWRRFHS